MPDGTLGPEMTLVERAELVTRDMEMITELVSRIYVEHRARIRRIPGARPDATTHAAVAGPLRAGVIQLSGVEYETDTADTGGHPIDLVALEGSGEVVAGGQLHQFTRGEVCMTLPDRPYAARMHGGSAALLQLPWSVAGQVAEAHTGLRAASLRFESMAPVSRTAAARWARTVAFVCHQLIDSRVSEISPLLTREMTRLAAGAMLDTFPSTAMTLDYAPAPRWVPPASVRRAAAFIDEQAGQPISIGDIAAAAGVSGRALQYAFRRYYDTTPTGYLCQVRLERARRELAASSPGGGVTVAAIARKWGWANPAHFAAAYARQHGQSPGQTLRA